MFNSCVLTVFSASNYCGVVGNLGAFIIFQADVFPRPVKYYANGEKGQEVKEQTNNIALQNYVIGRICDRITKKRINLMQYYVEKDDADTKHDGTIARHEWSDGLKLVLKLDIPFLELQTELGIPRLGVGGQKDGRIDYMAFLSQFQPYLHLLKEYEEHKENEKKASSRGLQELTQLLYANSQILQPILGKFDPEGDGRISKANFERAILIFKE